MGSSSSSLKKAPGKSRSSSHALAVESVTSLTEGGGSFSVRIDQPSKNQKRTNVEPKKVQKEVKVKSIDQIEKSVPITDAERMLRIYAREQALLESKADSPKKSSRVEADLSIESLDDQIEVDAHSAKKSNESGNNIQYEPDLQEKYPSDLIEKTVKNTRPLPDKFILDNSEILKKRKVEVALNPVVDKQAKQSDILHQLGMQGIINKRADPEKVMNDLRHLGMVKEDSSDAGYIISSGPPKRTAPRLRPLQVPTDTMQKVNAPWEHDVLVDQGDKCYEESMHQQTSNTAYRHNLGISKGEKLKLKMMDLDLL